MSEEPAVVDNSLQASEAPADVFASVSKEIRFSADGNDKLARFKDDTGLLATSYLEMEKMSSGKSKMLTDESLPDEISAFYKKMPGKFRAPDTVEGYTTPEIGEGQTLDAEFFGAMRSAALTGNVSTDSFSGMVKAYTEYTDAKITADTNSTEELLQHDWVGDYDKNIEIVERVFRDTENGDEMKAWFNSVGGGRNSMAMKWMLAQGKSTLDDTFVKGDPVPEEKDDYVPTYPKSPEMYRNGDDEDSVKGRAWHTKNGFVY